MTDRFRLQEVNSWGSGCGFRYAGPWFESSHCQNLYWTFVYCQLFWKDKRKRGREWPILKKKKSTVSLLLPWGQKERSMWTSSSLVWYFISVTSGVIGIPQNRFGSQVNNRTIESIHQICAGVQIREMEFKECSSFRNLLVNWAS